MRLWSNRDITIMMMMTHNS